MTEAAAELAVLASAAEVVLDRLRCTQPAYGAPGVDHCAACCGGTGYATETAEEERLAAAAAELLAAIRDLRGL